MFRKPMIWLLAAVLTLSCAGLALAVEVESGSTYCFSPEDFESEEALKGICITGLPDPKVGTVMLGSRVLRCGDILTAEQVGQMAFFPLKTASDASTEVRYLPIFENRVAPCASMAITVRGKEDKAPVAEDSTGETYKNLPNEGKLKVTDPEGEALTFTVTRNPKRGEVELRADGSFLYTPKKNKVGVDSFTYTAADPAGNVSREATVTIRILKPGKTEQYTDTVHSDARFEAEWLKNTGLFVGEQIGGNLCFQENQTLSRGEFLSMLIPVLELPMDQDAETAGLEGNIPSWLEPYLAAALRAGLTEDVAPNGELTVGDAAVMLAKGLDLTVPAAAEDGQTSFAENAVTVLNQNGFSLTADAPLTRGEAAKLLYALHQMRDKD